MIDIKGYEGLYAVTEEGKVWSYRRKKFLSPAKNNSGYLYVNLWKDGRMKLHTLHRLVAQTYIPNPHNYPEVNHKDENKENPHASNLEWCTHKYNMNFGTRPKKPVYCVELDRTFDSVSEAAKEIGAPQPAISFCVTGKQKTARGYHFRYA